MFKICKKKKEEITQFDRIDKLPPHHLRNPNWKYEVLRPWEPHPPSNYFELLYKENPWRLNPPSKRTIIIVLFIFGFFTFGCGFLPWLFTHFTGRLDYCWKRIVFPYWMLPCKQ